MYTVYGTPVVSRAQNRRVERVSPVESSRAVTPSWRSQYGNHGQPQRVYPIQRAQREYLDTLRPQTNPFTQSPSAPAPVRTAEASNLQMPGAEPLILAQRRPPDTDPDYIQKYTRRLAKAAESRQTAAYAKNREKAHTF